MRAKATACASREACVLLAVRHAATWISTRAGPADRSVMSSPLRQEYESRSKASSPGADDARYRAACRWPEAKSEVQSRRSPVESFTGTGSNAASDDGGAAPSAM